ncbi:MAG: Protein of unknown function DUF427 [uncultured Rubrobacteraceae bacterium]|uniref:DUF427 domain-containing protein n=1 Tax=uncultured Rubrobacteraceae bacterium TaxID=349277 RepID=A0A6J4PEY7_9ACTN|nr:MAG: Protein of unknown function DUF427 [uncultured Rubrobacteraceae bacterium]
MTLTLGTGPFGEQSAGEFNFEVTAPRGHALYLEDSPRRVRAVFGGETVADSRRIKLLHEKGHLPVYYFPEEDVRWDLLERTNHTTHCPFKGDAAYWSVRAGDRIAENGVWGYPEPLDSAPHISGLVAFYFDAMDAWHEEDEEISIHPKDPYHRVDVLESSRRVRISLGGEVVAETDRPRILFETGLPPRYYIPPEDVRQGSLLASETITGCPYKGTASYYSVEAGGERAEDVVWYYPEPLPEARKARDHLCFYDEKVDVELDGEPQTRPVTLFS